MRSESDHLLLKHAQKCGARVFQNVKVTEIAFSEEAGRAPGRPVSATFCHVDTGVTSEIKFDYIVDASGRVGLLSTKYFKNRNYTQSLKNIACWAYWKGTGAYGIGTPREGAPLAEALTGDMAWHNMMKFNS